jgi:hypothetical protein
MSLDLVVGIFADLDDEDEDTYTDYLTTFEAVNKALSAVGLPPHHEPQDLGGKEPWSCRIGSYAKLHYLRRIAAYLWAGHGLPEPGNEHNYRDPIVDAVLARSFREASPYRAAHLIYHSDADGFYLPLAFRDVIEPPEELEIDGGTLGSSYTLLDECQRIAAVLQLPLDHGLVWEGWAEWTPPEDITPRGALWRSYRTESETCWLLANACRVSLAWGCAIKFC